MIPTGSNKPDQRPVSAFDLALDIARELRAEGYSAGQKAERIIEDMIRAALRNGGIRS